MGKKELLFLGGLGVPAALFTPWFAVLGWFGYHVRPVPNSFLTLDPVSKFAQNLVQSSAGLERLDVLGVSYGGNAAVYAACLDQGFRDKVDRMIAVCAPLLGAPGLLDPLRGCLPRPLSQTLTELSKNSPLSRSIRNLGTSVKVPFELHCLYHERDWMAPFEIATLPGVSKNHKLKFKWRAVPPYLMHQAACINPTTLETVIQILLGSPRHSTTS